MRREMIPKSRELEGLGYFGLSDLKHFTWGSPQAGPRGGEEWEQMFKANRVLGSMVQRICFLSECGFQFPKIRKEAQDIEGRCCPGITNKGHLVGQSLRLVPQHCTCQEAEAGEMLVGIEVQSDQLTNSHLDLGPKYHLRILIISVTQKNCAWPALVHKSFGTP